MNKKLMAQYLPKMMNWDVCPTRKLYEKELLKRRGKKLRVCTIPYGKYWPGDQKALMKIAEAMPEGHLKELNKVMLPLLNPPHEIKIHQSSLVRGCEKPMQDDLLTNQYLSRIINTLALNQHSARKISEIINHLPGAYQFSVDQIDKYLYVYWNTRRDHGWTVQRENELEKFLKDSHNLRNTFDFELENGFGQLSHLEVYLNLGIASPEEWVDHLMINTMKKYDDALNLLNVDKPERVWDGSGGNVLGQYKLREFHLSASRELSMILNRISKTRADLLKNNSSAQGESARWRVYGSNASPAPSKPQKYSIGSG